MGHIPLLPKERIAAHVIVDQDSGCWIWTGSAIPGPRPYGRLTFTCSATGRKRSISAHRYSYAAHVGDVPAGMCVCHTCDNPPCVNPAHLFLGTKKDNADDRDKKGRNKKPPYLCGSASPRAKLTDEDVRFIRSSPMTSRALAKIISVSDGHIRAIRRGENFKPGFSPDPPKDAP